ncbi:hypothetical protein P8452_38707 [Trifolium repens]|nr:hypothetical protein QL285_071045 [Trifolium repens]WJX52613.1 hypothetical protein P8452_38707 [Trifolium repens]
MGNCGSNPKTNEGLEPVPVPVPVTEEVKVEHATEQGSVEDNKTLSTLLNENVEVAKKAEEVKVEAEEVKAESKEKESTTEEVKVQEEKPKIEETKIDA